MLVGAVVALAIAVVLTVFPGPAIVFYALAGALVATQSMRVARLLDRGEVATRGLMLQLRRKWRAARRQYASS